MAFSVLKDDVHTVSSDKPPIAVQASHRYTNKILLARASYWELSTLRTVFFCALTERTTMIKGPQQRKSVLFAVALVLVLSETSLALSTRIPSLHRNVYRPAHVSNVAGDYVPSSKTMQLSAHAMSTRKESDGHQRDPSLRKRLRQITGFSLTAFRATMRAATGISLTAIYASAFAATSAFVRKTMTWILAPLPAWFRYFLQPFLILYYAPLFILRNLAGPTGKRAKETHELFVDGFKSAVEAAEKKADGYWPVHVNGKSSFVSDIIFYTAF